MRRVHRLATPAEKERRPNAYTFNRASGRFHNRAGFQIMEAESVDGMAGDGDRGAGKLPALPAKEAGDGA